MDFDLLSPDPPPSLRTRLDADAVERLREGGPRPGALRLEWQLNERDLAAAARAVMRVRLRPTALICWALAAMLVAVGLLLGSELPVFYGVGIALMPWFMRRSAESQSRQMLKREPALRETFIAEFDDDGIFMRSPRAYMVADWSLFPTVWESAEGFILFQQQQLMTLVPKHAFADEAAIDRFRQMAEERTQFRRV